MKITQLRAITQKYTAPDCSNMMKGRYERTLKNYSPVFSVTLDTFIKNIEKYYHTKGMTAVVDYNNHINAVGEKETCLYLTRLSKDGTEMIDTYNLFKAIVPLEEGENLYNYEFESIDSVDFSKVKVNLLKKGMIKGINNRSRHEKLVNELDDIAWETIAETVAKIFYARRAEKQAKLEEQDIQQA